MKVMAGAGCRICNEVLRAGGQVAAHAMHRLIAVFWQG
tara:strand:- start:797 stop:910 length:114 start_codon:yes stop_codon:yes gene_type:complete